MGSGIVLLEGGRPELADVFHSTFLNFDPYEPRFRANSSRRSILFPTDSYHLTSVQFEALLASIDSDKKFFISEIGWGAESFKKGRHYLCNYPTFQQYTALNVGVENAIFGVDGTWGLLLSDELHAIVAGDEKFFQAFKSNYTGTNDLIQFRRYWAAIREERNVSVDWLEPLLRSVGQ
jgi:hypothetical protein